MVVPMRSTLSLSSRSTMSWLGVSCSISLAMKYASCRARPGSTMVITWLITWCRANLVPDAKKFV